MCDIRKICLLLFYSSTFVANMIDPPVAILSFSSPPLYIFIRFHDLLYLFPTPSSTDTAPLFPPPLLPLPGHHFLLPPSMIKGKPVIKRRKTKKEEERKTRSKVKNKMRTKLKENISHF